MAERIPIIAGNWKMFKTSAEAKDLVSALLPLVEKRSHCQIVVCPPFTALCEVATLLLGRSRDAAAKPLNPYVMSILTTRSTYVNL